MRQDLEKLLELQRKTKAGEVAPLVDVATKNFWLWPGKAYWAYIRRDRITIAQLELRKRIGSPKDQRVANVVTLLSQLYDGASWYECAEMFSHVMAEDAWPMVLWLVEEMSWDDLGIVRFLDKVGQQYGKLTPEEMELIVAHKTVGEVAVMLETIFAEGREKVMPRKRSSRPRRGYGWWVLLILCAFAFLWSVGSGIVKLVRWLVA